MFLFLTPVNTRNCCSLNQISTWCFLLKRFLSNNVMLFCSQRNVKNFPSWVYFCFYPAFYIGTIIMTTCSTSSIYFWDRADFRVPGPKRLQLHLTMCIPIITYSFPETYEYSKNELNSFIFEIQQIIESLWL